jgi:hypothetical protein
VNTDAPTESPKPGDSDFNAITVECPQPWPIWVLVTRESGKRKVAFSFDGAPSEHYQKMVGVKAWIQSQKALSESVEQCEHFGDLVKEWASEAHKLASALEFYHSMSAPGGKATEVLKEFAKFKETV